MSGDVIPMRPKASAIEEALAMDVLASMRIPFSLCDLTGFFQAWGIGRISAQWAIERGLEAGMIERSPLPNHPECTCHFYRPRARACCG